MDDSPMADRLNISAEDLNKPNTEKVLQLAEEYYIYGMDMRGSRLQSVTGYSSDLNALKDTYLKTYPQAVFIRIGVAIQEKARG